MPSGGFDSPQVTVVHCDRWTLRLFGPGPGREAEADLAGPPLDQKPERAIGTEDDLRASRTACFMSGRVLADGPRQAAVFALRAGAGALSTGS